MTAVYKHGLNGTIIRLSDMAFIPADPANTDYIKYLEDVANNVEVADADPTPPLPKHQVRKSIILSRLTAAQVKQAISLMDVMQQERWRAADRPAINYDDPETLAILQAIGANHEVVMAPE